MPVGAWARALGLYRDRIEELAPMGRSYGWFYGFTISDSTTMSSSYASELSSAGGFLIA